MSTESNIIRTKRRDNFTIINNDIINAKMSLQALGLLVFLLSKPDDWKIQKKSLSKNFKNGRDATNTAFNELIDLGYIETVQVRQEGKFKSVNYLVYDQPEPQTGNQYTVGEKSPQPEKPSTEKPSTEKPYTENPSLLNTIDNKDGLNKNSSLNPNGLNEQSDSDRERIFELHQQEQNTFIAPQKSCAKKDPPKKTTHQTLMDLYWEWYKGLHDGIEPSITKADGMAMSQLRKFLEKQAANKEQEYRGLGKIIDLSTEDFIQREAVKMLEYIFNNWHLLRPFEQSGLSIRQINSNITNIINQIKNGRQKTTAKAGSTAASIKQAFDNIDKAFGGN